MVSSDVVIAGILPKDLDRMEYALNRLSAEHFSDQYQKVLWKIMEYFYGQYKGLPSRDSLSDRLDRQFGDDNPALVLKYLNLFDNSSKVKVSDSDFKYAVDSLVEAHTNWKTGEITALTFEILENGAVVDGERLEGATAAREFALKRLSEISYNSTSELSEGTVQDEMEDILSEYAETKKASEEGKLGLKFGIDCLDEWTNGISPGELVLVAAFTSAGKSHLVAQTAWNAIMRGENVFLATSETVREQMRRRVLSRHSRLPQFGIPEGLNSKLIKEGKLTKEMEDIYTEVVRDFTSNKEYGSLRISQIPRGGTMAFIEHRASVFNKEVPVGLVAIDSLQLLSYENDEREGFTRMLKDAKVWATSFDGRGVPLISPWQMSRNAFSEARDRDGIYTMSSLSDTSEAEKTSDMIITLFKDYDEGKVKLQVLKNRDSPEMESTPVDFDYRNSYIGGGDVPVVEGESASTTSSSLSLESIASSFGGLTL